MDSQESSVSPMTEEENTPNQSSSTFSMKIIFQTRVSIASVPTMGSSGIIPVKVNAVNKYIVSTFPLSSSWSSGSPPVKMNTPSNISTPQLQKKVKALIH